MCGYKDSRLVLTFKNRRFYTADELLVWTSSSSKELVLNVNTGDEYFINLLVRLSVNTVNRRVTAQTAHRRVTLCSDE